MARRGETDHFNSGTKWRGDCFFLTMSEVAVFEADLAAWITGVGV